MDELAPTPRATSSPLAWALFLGVSWTWCIGMFLPVLLVRDYGPWAWVIFAIPNCVGAAAMGWAMRSADDSWQFVRRHRVMCEVFSLVTMAFQIFFATWMLPRLVGPIGYLGVAVMVQAAFTPIRSPRTLLILSGIVYIVSLIAAGILAARGSLIFPQAVTVSGLDLLGLACVCLLGFIFSPYLDLTFHQARQATSVRGGQIAFAVGFCVVFAAMIVLSFFYAETFVRMRGLSVAVLAIHLAVQMAFTVDAHAAALRKSGDAESDEPKLGQPMLALAIAIGFAAGLAGSIDWLYHGLPVGEMVYRIFLSFYGLIVPAYLLTARATRWQLLFPGAVVLALPPLWMAFIERQMAWAILAAVIVVIAGVACRTMPVTKPAPKAFD